jgi:opacity protein-like surface antigen
MPLLLAATVMLTLTSVPAEAADERRWYVGLYGNTSWSTLSTGGKYIDNGDRRSNIAPSVAIGREYLWAAGEHLRWLVGFDFFFDHINKTVVQGDQLHTNDFWLLPTVIAYPMANQPVYKTNFLSGARLKLGMSFSRRVTLYGHLGLAYWDRDIYLEVGDDPRYDLFNQSDRYYGDFRISWVYGLGGAVHLTEHWAAHFDYKKASTRIADRFLFTGETRYYNYLYDAQMIRLGIDIFSAGLAYYF